MDNEAQLLHQVQNIYNVGYQSVLLIDNMETLWVYLEAYIIGLLIMTFCWLYIYLFKQKLPNRVVRLFNYLRGLLCWNFILRFFLEGYLELSIGCMINIKYARFMDKTVVQAINMDVTYVISFFLFVYPFFIYMFFRKLTAE